MDTRRKLTRPSYGSGALTRATRVTRQYADARGVWGVVPPPEQSSEIITAHLRREFENPGPALRTVASRLSRGAYKRSERPSEPSVTDSRGRVVRAVGKTQT